MEDYIDVEHLSGAVMSGEQGLHQLARDRPAAEAAAVRRAVVAQATNSKLDNLGSIPADSVSLGRIENAIGAVAVPVGVFGPIMLSGEFAIGKFFVPMATTERTLIASAARGAKAITKSGGVSARVFHDGMTRAPLFACESIAAAIDFRDWVLGHIEELREVVQGSGVTRHGDLREIQAFIAGNNVWLRCEFGTGDAMGMNMVTVATETLAQFLSKAFPHVELLALSGNLCSDKKESAVNNLLGRGKSVVADALIRGEFVESVLKTSAAAIARVNNAKNLLGSAVAGSHKFNAHFANIVSAVFLATGQDMAEVVESSSGYTWAENRGDREVDHARNGNDDLYIAVTLPALEVGTIGGGTELGPQRDSLAMMGVAGGSSDAGSNAKKFAEVLAAAVLAGELGLLSSLAHGDLGLSTAWARRAALDDQ